MLVKMFFCFCSALLRRDFRVMAFRMRSALMAVALLVWVRKAISVWLSSGCLWRMFMDFGGGHESFGRQSLAVEFRRELPWERVFDGSACC